MEKNTYILISVCKQYIWKEFNAFVKCWGRYLDRWCLDEFVSEVSGTIFVAFCEACKGDFWKHKFVKNKNYLKSLWLVPWLEGFERDTSVVIEAVFLLSGP